MSSLGSYLRELRERRGVSLEEIARTTRVGRPYLEALEAGEFSQLPAPVFTRGFVVAYCQALGVPADEALAHYGGRVKPPEEIEQASATLRDRTATRGRGSVLVSFVLVIVLGIALIAFALVLQSGRDGGDRRAETSRPSRESQRVERAPAATTDTPPTGVAAVTVAPPSAPAPPPPVPAVTAPPAAPPPAPPFGATRDVAPVAPGSPALPAAERPVPLPAVSLTQQEVTAALGSVTAPYRLVARTSALTWIRVRTDDGRQSDETVPPGQTREWVSNRPFTVSVGNAGGVRFELNGRALPPLGPSGAVIARLVLPAESP
jgi:cytoskeletal protein RodZ